MYLKYLSPDRNYCSFSPSPPEYVINPDYWTKIFTINPQDLVSYTIQGDKAKGYNFSYENVDLFAVFLWNLVLYEDLNKEVLAHILDEFDKHIDVLKVNYQTSDWYHYRHETNAIKMAIQTKNIVLFDLLINAGANPKEQLENKEGRPVQICEYLFSNTYNLTCFDHNGSLYPLLEEHIQLLQVIEPYIDFNEPAQVAYSQEDLNFWLNSEKEFNLKYSDRSYESLMPKPIVDAQFPFYYRVIKQILKDNTEFKFKKKFSIDYMFKTIDKYNLSTEMIKDLESNFFESPWFKKIEKKFLEKNINASNTTSKIIKI